MVAGSSGTPGASGTAGTATAAGATAAAGTSTGGAGGTSPGGASTGGIVGASGMSTGGTAGTTAAGMSAGGMAGAGMGAGGMAGAGMGGAGAAGMAAGGASTSGMGGTSAGGMAGADMGGGGMDGGGGAATGEDLDMTADQFSCIGDWQQISGFRITNLLGHLDEAIAVAESPTGGVYPVGTILQHLPTEAMVKRAAGFSAETRDWEFFQLSLSADGVTTITNRGTTDVTTMGNTCASCHSMVPEQWDFVCNTWGDNGGDCGFDFDQMFLDMQLAMDTRCQ